VRASADSATATASITSFSGGLSGSRLVSRDTVIDYLTSDKVRFDLDRAKSFVNSFEGDITARIMRPGESRLRYLDSDHGQGSFLTSTAFASSVDASKGLYLSPYLNTALTRQVVTAQQRSIVFEGLVRDGGRNVMQTVITDQSKFVFGPGYRY